MTQYLVERDHHLDEAGVALPRRYVYRQRTVLSLLVQVGSVTQQQPTQLRVPEDGRHVQRGVAGDVGSSGLGAASQQQLRHAVVGSTDGVVQRRAALVVLEFDVGVQLEQRVHRHVQTSTHRHQQSGLPTSLTLHSPVTDKRYIDPRREKGTKRKLAACRVNVTEIQEKKQTDRQTDRQTSHMARCVTYAVARIRNRRNSAYFSLWH